jgi:hypothetical protein
MKKASIALLILGFNMPMHVQAQWFDWPKQNIPRHGNGEINTNADVPSNPSGVRNFSGYWVPVEASGSIFDLENFQPWALAVMEQHEASFFVKDPRFNCLPDGPASYLAGASVGGSRQIVQTEDFIAVLNGDMTFRQIHLDGRPPAEVIIPSWLGYSIGHIEDNILVIETQGFNDKSWLTREGIPHTDALKITERYTREDFGHMTLEISYSDEGLLKQPVSATVSLEYRENNHILEIVCNESEKAQTHYNGELSQSLKKTVEVPLDVMESYTGRYQGIWLGNIITADVFIQDGKLYLTRSPRYSDTGGNSDNATSVLVPQSVNAFDSSFGLGWIFNSDEDGKIASVSEVHVSGAWDFKRVEE